MNRNKDLSENIVYPVANIPVLTSENERLSELPTYRELIHWHNDFEFINVYTSEQCISVISIKSFFVGLSLSRMTYISHCTKAI